MDWLERAEFSDNAGRVCASHPVAPRIAERTRGRYNGRGHAADILRGALLPAVLGALLGMAVAVAIISLWQLNRRPRQFGPCPNAEERLQLGAEEEMHATNAHWSVRSSMWCVTPEQFFNFIEEVHLRYPDEDPSAHKVVAEMIRPRTRDSHVSYALLQNPQGVPVKHFVTHAWDEGVKSFGEALSRVQLTGGLWICFLANPQTWPRHQLHSLLVPVWSSPFASALREAENVIVVRNSNINMYTRLWCVFELYMAVQVFNKPLVVVGPEPDEKTLDGTGVGFDAACTDKVDRATLRLAMREHVAEVNRVVGTVMRQPPML